MYVAQQMLLYIHIWVVEFETVSRYVRNGKTAMITTFFLFILISAYIFRHKFTNLAITVV